MSGTTVDLRRRVVVGWLWLFCILNVGIGGWGVALAEEDQGAVEVVTEAPLSGGDRAFWQAHWQRFGLFYAKADGTFFVCEKWDPRYESSVGMAVESWREDHKRVELSSSMGWLKRETRKPLLEEAQAAVLLAPRFEVGEYGLIHSVKVEKVVGPMEMIVSEPWLLSAGSVRQKRRADELVGERYTAMVERRAFDERAAATARRDMERYFGGGNRGGRSESGRSSSRAGSGAISSSQIRSEIDSRFEQREAAVKRQEKARGLRIRLLGYPTEGVLVGDRFKGSVGRGVLGGEGRGMSVVMVADASLKLKAKGSSLSRFGSGRDTPTMTMVSGGLFKAAMAENDFATLVGEAGLGKKGFVEMARGQMREYGEKATGRIVRLLESRRREAREAHAAAVAAVAAEVAAEAHEGGGGGALSGKSEWYKRQMAKKAAEEEGGGGDSKVFDPLAGKSDWYKAQYAKKLAEEAARKGEKVEVGGGGGGVVKDDKYFQEKYGKKDK